MSNNYDIISNDHTLIPDIILPYLAIVCLFNYDIISKDYDLILPFLALICLFFIGEVKWLVIIFLIGPIFLIVSILVGKFRSMKRLGLKAMFTQLFTWVPIISLYIYYRNSALLPLISFNGRTGWVSIILTFSTYFLNRVAIIWGTSGLVMILTRYVLYWFGLRGGVWAPIANLTGWFYQPWVRLFPICVGGMVDFGPIFGQHIHRFVARYFGKVLWCSLPPGVLEYDEIENTFTVNYDLFERFCNVFFWLIPKRKVRDVYVFLPLPSNCPGYGTGYLLPISVNKGINLEIVKSYDIISEMSRMGLLTSERLDQYFLDLRVL